MASFYTKVRKTASRLLNKFGEDVTIRRNGPGRYNPATLGVGQGESVEWTSSAVRSGITGDMLGDSRIQIGDMQILVDCEGQENIPAIGDTVVFADGSLWKVTLDMPVSPAGTTVLYKGIIRKG